MSKYYIELIVEKVEDLINFFKISKLSNHKFFYRGQSAKYTKLEPKIQRGQGSLISEEELETYENNMIKEYQRKVYHHLRDIPAEDDYLEWLSIVQHYGGPTRLLDFTHSLFIALFYSLHKNTNNDANIWVLHDTSNRYEDLEKHNSEYLIDVFKHDLSHPCKYIKIDRNIKSTSMEREGSLPLTIERKPCKKWIYGCDDTFAINGEFVRFVMRGDITIPGVFMIEPFRLNERMIAQQGIFAVPFTLCASFEKNLSAMFEDDFKIEHNSKPNMVSKVDIKTIINDCPLIKFIIKEGNFKEFNYFLQQMNIKTETMFPDFEGLTLSLQDKMPVFPDIEDYH